MDNTKELQLVALKSVLEASKDALKAGRADEARRLASKAEDMALKMQLEQTLGAAQKSSLFPDGSTPRGGDFSARLKASGLGIDKQRVNIGTFGAKTDALVNPGTDAEVMQIAPASYGQARLFAYPSFGAEGLGTALTVQGIEQTARSLASASSTVIAAGGNAAKPQATVGATRTSFAASMVAVVSEAINIQQLSADGGALDAFVRSELGFNVEQGIDYALVHGLLTASGTTTRSQGADTLFDAMRRGVTDLRKLGYAPSAIIASPATVESIDLFRDGQDRYYAGGPAGIDGLSRLWGAEVLETASIADDKVLIVDKARYGRFFLGGVQVAVNPYSDGTLDLFGTNTAKIRVESPVCVAVQTPAAVNVLTLA